MTEKFIEKSRLIHGDNYDYSKVEYINNNTKVIILCQEHNEFQQTPKSHLKGAGCGKCAGTGKSNTKEFIEKAKLIHCDKYDYSKVDYINSISSVLIICEIHGEFQQTPKSHLKGAGCSKCSKISNANKRKKPIEQFIIQSKEKHGEKYDYSKVDYKNNSTKVIIICKTHGEFEQTPYNHIKSKGCLKCIGYNTLTTDEFIEKAKLVHGDKYDYSKVEYINSNTSILIICKEHGDFLQKPIYHYWNSSGCPKCAINCKSNMNEFIEKAKLVHCNIYDYSKVDYKTVNDDVIIICKTHGEFIQTPYRHLRSKGCLKCIGYYTLTTDEFIEKANLVHGDKYDYSNVEYKNTDTKVLIICKKHGIFNQISGDHLNGHGCQKCYYETISERFLQTTEEFIEKAKLVHGDKYDYSKVEYKKCDENVIIVCKIHGDFLQTPIGHYNSGSGCQKCGIILRANKRRTTLEEFIEKSKLVHGDKYDYSKVEYKKCDENVIIVCKIHSEFLQTPIGHYNSGCGCPKCCNNNYSKKQILWLNFLSKFYNMNIKHALNDGEFKIPTTKYKADGYCEETNTIYEFHGDFWHGNPEIFNQDDINKKTNCSFQKLYEKTIIKETKIKELGYNLVVIWENKWDKINNAVRIIQKKFIKHYIS